MHISAVRLDPSALFWKFRYTWLFLMKAHYMFTIVDWKLKEKFLAECFSQVCPCMFVLEEKYSSDFSFANVQKGFPESHGW